MKSRIEKLRDYLFEVLNEVASNDEYQINADFLGEVGDYSLDKIPVETEAELPWIIGVDIKKDVYSLRSRRFYSQDSINNLKNIGFFENFEEIINSNNDKGIMPEIDGIESIKCLNPGTLIDIDGTNASFDIQIQITYRSNNEGGTTSL